MKTEYPQYIGIDIGKKSIHVAIATGSNPKKFPIREIEYKHPHWYRELMTLVMPNALICAEPTGWHYLQPVITALDMIADGVSVLQVNHQTTASIRRAYFGRAKNDNIDAQALAFIARQHVEADTVIGVKPYDRDRHQSAHSLRLLVNEHRRLTKQSTRRLNQLDQMGHSIMPQLVIQKSTWLKCVAVDAITPHQIIELSKHGHETMNRNQLRHIEKLANNLPDIQAHPMIIDNIQRMHTAWAQVNSEIEEVDEEIQRRVLVPPFSTITKKWATVPYLSSIGIASLHIATNGEADKLTISQFKASVGVAPTTGISGSIDTTGKTGTGYTPAKQAVHWCVQSLLKTTAPDNPIRRYFKSGHNASHCRRKLAGILSGIARNPNGAWKT